MTMQMLSEAGLCAWAERARPGEDVAYCIGGERPHPTIARVARALKDSGLVALTSRRGSDGFRFIAQRLPNPLPSRVLARAIAPRGRFALAADDGKRTTLAVLRLLVRAAGRGDVCPTNAELARMVGLKDFKAASYRVQRLVADGKIVVEQPSPIERRVVTIVATGKATRRAVI